MLRVIWKEEIEGYGPIRMIGADENGEPIDLDPIWPEPRWVSLADAEAVAKEHNVEIEVW